VGALGSRVMQPPTENRPASVFVPFDPAEVDTCVPTRFEKIVRAHGAREAVTTAARTLTYDALNACANRIAHEVLDRRGPTGEPVALLLDNDASMVSAIIGVLKAGKAYVPLDPRLPATRLAEIIEHARPGLILSDLAHLTEARRVMARRSRTIPLAP